MMGWKLNENESLDMLACSYDNGITLIDTSVSYARGLCHEIIGNCLARLKKRNEFFIATKVGGISNDNDPPEFIGYSRANIIRQCELSLKQLKIESIDLLQLHHPTSVTSYEEMLEALNALSSAGKIKHFGVCNYGAADFFKFYERAKLAGLSTPISNQFSFSLLDQSNKDSLFTTAQLTNSGTITWGPLSSGLLTDWYTNNDTIKPNSRIDIGRENKDKSALLHKKQTQEILMNLKVISSKTKISTQKLALLWILKKSPFNSVLIGPSKLSHLTELISAETDFDKNTSDLTFT